MPVGWEQRTVAVTHPIGTRGNVGRCLESHDLAASKLYAYRPKDRDFVRTLLVEGLVGTEVLLIRLDALPMH